MTRKDRNEFAAYCRGVTDAQVEGIIAKERAAGRVGYRKIAEAERELASARHPRWGR